MSESNSNDISRESIFKKGFMKIFIIGISLLIIGFIFSFISNIIPRVYYTDPGYDDYLYLMRFLSSLLRLFIQTGIVLFSLSSFIGAMVDRTLSNSIKKGMVIASGVALVALVFSWMVMPYIY
ncbi:MAG: hypothetical protein JSV62_02890 [Promethearchaeota archaeon]|nr:MAG: hypothetical protein JSV62_02890 [Candidatus Lokiarchaeota archaeon]